MDLKFKLLFFGLSIVLLLCNGEASFAQSTTATPGGQASDALGGIDVKEQRGLVFLPGVRSSISYSDNISLRPDGTQVSGFKTEISPYAFASINNDKANGQAYFSLRNFYQSSDPSGFTSGRIDFRGNGTVELYKRWLFLEGSAFAFNVNPLTFGPIAFDAASVPTYTYRLQGFTAAPYVLGNLGTFANYRGQYSYGVSEITGFNSLRTTHRLTGQVSSGSQFNVWGWGWQGDQSQRSVQGSPVTSHRSISTGSLYYFPEPDLRLGLSVRYEQIDSLFNKSGKDYGFGPGASVDWNPSKRTSIKGSVTQQYYGTIGNFGLSHRWERFALNVAYDKAIISGNDASFLNISQQDLFNAGGPAAALNPVYRSLIADALYGGYGVPVGLGVVNDALVLRNGGSVGLTYLLPTGSLALIVSKVTRNTQISTYNPVLGGTSVGGYSIPLDGTFFGLVKTRAVSIDWDYKLDSRSKFKSQIIYADNLLPAILSRNQRTSFQSSYSTRLTSETTATFGLRHTKQQASGYKSTSYDENAVFSTLDVRF
jgi:uncharacterized protein (PEP-CTERM system associated)